MIKNWIFVYQFSQYRGDLLPCTLADFNKIVDSQDVAWRINTRQEVEKAIADGLPLDNYIANSKFQSFCQRHAAETSVQSLSFTRWHKPSTCGCRRYKESN